MLKLPSMRIQSLALSAKLWLRCRWQTIAAQNSVDAQVAFAMSHSLFQPRRGREIKNMPQVQKSWFPKAPAQFGETDESETADFFVWKMVVPDKHCEKHLPDKHNTVNMGMVVGSKMPL